MPQLPRGELTALLNAWGKGGQGEEALFDALEPDLRRLARSCLDDFRAVQRKLDAPDLVNETYVRLKKYLKTKEDVSFENRALFFSLVVGVMRHVLLDARKRGGKKKLPTEQLTLSASDGPREQPRDVDLDDLEYALKRLKAKNPLQARAMELHYMAGWSLVETAELLGFSTAKLKRELAVARQWFRAQLTASPQRSITKVSGR